ncbi:MAG: hypothetical protein H7840_00275 [Alphaproteobacteria bacterium]
MRNYSRKMKVRESAGRASTIKEKLGAAIGGSAFVVLIATAIGNGAASATVKEVIEYFSRVGIKLFSSSDEHETSLSKQQSGKVRTNQEAFDK